MSDFKDIIERAHVASEEAELLRLHDYAVSLLVEYWSRSPHGAMEYLEVCAIAFPYENAHSLVRETTMRWRQMSNYSWSAGGNADHCFLAALLMTGNYDLVDVDHYDNCIKSIEYRAASESYLARLRDKEAKLKALRRERQEVLKALVRVNFDDGFYEFVRAIDGDTIVVLPPQELRGWMNDVHIRLYGIETPELWEEFGRDYQKHLEDLCAIDGRGELYIVWERERPNTSYGRFPQTSFERGIGNIFLKWPESRFLYVNALMHILKYTSLKRGKRILLRGRRFLEPSKMTLPWKGPCARKLSTTTESSATIKHMIKQYPPVCLLSYSRFPRLGPNISEFNEQVWLAFQDSWTFTCPFQEEMLNQGESLLDAIKKQRVSPFDIPLTYISMWASRQVI